MDNHWSLMFSGNKYLCGDVLNNTLLQQSLQVLYAVKLWTEKFVFVKIYHRNITSTESPERTGSTESYVDAIRLTKVSTQNCVN